ncbi:hypothetical protein ATN89_12190 [Comamonas thiooxydans]|nr:hypothetical protein ATN89_12190 [Comamonas thiooxydans]
MLVAPPPLFLVVEAGAGVISRRATDKAHHPLPLKTLMRLLFLFRLLRTIFLQRIFRMPCLVCAWELLMGLMRRQMV